ncbi:hypothetical protein H7X87_00885 [Acetobacteraceae bacterium]|nr:hypothetical protein [Candidatus Parcubacteria bacterium]
MYFSAGTLELVSFFSYFFQELGVMLAVGGMTVILALYLAAVRDGAVEVSENRLARAAFAILFLGVVIMILSGGSATALHFYLSEENTILTPVYLFKWGLIAFLAALAIYQRSSPLTHYFSLGFAGASWYALFVLHTVAPILSWMDLGILYVAGVTGFMFMWTALVYMMRKGSNAVPMKSVKIGYNIKPTSMIFKTKPASPVVTFTPIPLKPVAKAPAVPPVPAAAAAPVPHKPASVPPLSIPKPVITPHEPLLHATTTSSTLLPPPPSIPQKPHEAEPIKDPDASPDLPAIRVMPRTPGDVGGENRASVVKFDSDGSVGAPGKASRLK